MKEKIVNARTCTNLFEAIKNDEKVLSIFNKFSIKY